jgi:Choline/ethanolamine kinase
MDFTFNECRLAEYGESELISHILSSPRISPGSAVHIISPNLIAKHVLESSIADELEGIRFAQQLRLPVPGIKRVVRKARDAYIIMSRIHGRTMEAAWPNMSWLSTICTVFQLRHCIKTMRSRISPTAGSLITGKCNSIWLDDYYGLPEHATPEVLFSFIQFWLQYHPRRKRINAQRINIRELHKLPAIQKYFVFTHQDLAPRNLLLDEQDNLWLVDWEYSGWYPNYFEYAGMQNSGLHLITLADKLRWWLFCFISVGIYRNESRALAVVRGKCMRYPLARKNKVLQEGAHFDAFHLRKHGI